MLGKESELQQLRSVHRLNMIESAKGRVDGASEDGTS